MFSECADPSSPNHDHPGTTDTPGDGYTQESGTNLATTSRGNHSQGSDTNTGNLQLKCNNWHNIKMIVIGS